MNSNELYNYLKNDSDNYYKTFNSLDFKARNINNIEEYIKNIEKSLYYPTKDEQEKVKRSIIEANSRLEKINSSWFIGNKAKELLWNIGYFNGDLYENGLPHTRGNIIMLPEKVNKYTEDELTNTLIHEKVHIYQKVYKNDVQKYLNEYNFKKVKKRDKYDNTRSNSDSDNIIYEDNNRNIYKAIYNNNPKNYSDVTYFPINNPLYEHPFEKMAYLISESNI